MKNKTQKYILSAILIFLAKTVSATDKTLQSVHAVDITITQSECMKIAKEALLYVGIEEWTIIKLDKSIGGDDEDSTYTVICRADKGLMFIAILHPDGNLRKVIKFDEKIQELAKSKK
ncbi:MAG: hypothetical protein ABW170_17460 [Candidatus Thiodiazotropha sp. L084R]